MSKHLEKGESLNNKILLSIIIPIYNVERYLEKCLDSVITQCYNSGQNIEVILVNDGSTDKCFNIINRYSQRFDILRIVNQQNEGLSSARNAGFEISSGDYIWFIDSDDFIIENSIIKISKFIDDSLFDIIAFGRYKGDINKYKKLSVSKRNFTTIGRLFFINSKFQMPVFLYVFRREFLIKNNLKFEIGLLHEDLLFTPRAIYLANKIQILSDILYFHHTRHDSITSTINIKRCFDLIEIAELLGKYSFNLTLTNIEKIIFNRIRFFALTQSLMLAFKTRNLGKFNVIKVKVIALKDILLVVEEDRLIYKLEVLLLKFNPILFCLILEIKDKILLLFSQLISILIYHCKKH